MIIPVLLLLSLTGTLSTARKARNVEELSRCVRMAEPLVHNPEFVLPLTNAEIRNVCRMWGAFVDCVRSYTNHFLTPDQLDAFGEAIEPSMESIHQLCADDVTYREAYLAYAPCMKTMYISPKHCGTHYEYLADLVKGTTAVPDLICCAHHKFRSCVLSETPKECGTVVPTTQSFARNTRESGVAATHFVTSTLDRALGFLMKQCKNYTLNSRDCPGYEAYSIAPLQNIGDTTSPYDPSTGFTWTQPSNIHTKDQDETSHAPGTTGYDQSDRLQKGFPGYKRDFYGNRIDGDEPTSQQFTRSTSGGSTLGATGLFLIVTTIWAGLSVRSS